MKVSVQREREREIAIKTRDNCQGSKDYKWVCSFDLINGYFFWGGGEKGPHGVDSTLTLYPTVLNDEHCLLFCDRCRSFEP